MEVSIPQHERGGNVPTTARHLDFITPNLSQVNLSLFYLLAFNTAEYCGYFCIIIFVLWCVPFINSLI